LPDSNQQQDSIAAALAEVSDKLAALVKDEIELAKAEMAAKVKSLRNGIIAAVIISVLGFFSVGVALGAAEWGLNSATNSIWLGFVIILVAIIVVIGGLGFYAFKKLKVGAPQPTMAIDEAKKIRATLTAKPEAKS
jgi:cytochrome c biogenesis protein CcdA